MKTLEIARLKPGLPDEAQEVFLSPKDIMGRYGISRRSVNQWIDNGKLPKPIIFSGTTPRFLLSEILEIERALMAQR